MHLVWGGGKIFLKPLPRYLLEPEFWTSNLPPGAPTGDGQVADLITGGKISATRQGVSASTRVPMALYGSPPLPRPGIRESALGLLYTYACLIAHPVDLKLALEQGLIPKDGQNEPDWATWRKLAAELLQPKISRQVHRRFWRGELRLGRLNWIYVFRDMPSFQMYHNLWHSYTDFFAANVSWVATSTIYGAIVLTAMQVGLSTDALKDNVAFQQASYGFTVFAILGPIIIVSLVLVVLIIVLIPNWINTRSAERQLEPPWPTTTMTSVEIA
jgi:hypothetical protein